MIDQQTENTETGPRRYALCVGIGTYTSLANRDLRYATADAVEIADRLADPQRGNFTVTRLTEPAQTTKEAIEEAVQHLLSTPDRRTEDLALLYFSCHGDIDQTNHTFCLLPSNASLQTDGQYDPTALIGIADFARWFANATIQNIVVFLDVCHSGGAGEALQRFELNLETGPNFFFIGAARLDQAARQSSRFQHGLFTYCLLRAFEQPPTADGWLTVSQIHTFIRDELPWFAKEQPTQIQSWSVSVNDVPLLRNPGYPELAPLPPVWNIPLARNPFFTGQEDLLSQLAHMLQGTQKTALTQPHALSGLGGIGKTQLALEYAYRHRQDYHAVLWGHAESTEALTSSFLEIAQVLDLPEKNEPDQSIIVEAVQRWLSKRPHWLFILDNADDLGLVQMFLPPTFRGHLLLTTRAQATGKIVESKLEVEVMRPEIGALLLLRRAGIVSKEMKLEEAPSETAIPAKELAEEVGGLPLALDQAGAYIEVTGCSLADYQQQYQTRKAELLALRNGPPALPGAWKDDHPEPVATTWSLSFAKVELASPIAAELLRACAFLAPDAIPEDLLVQILETPLASSQRRRGGLLDEAVAILRAYSLIQRNTTEKTFSLHRLVQTVLRESLPTKTQQDCLQHVISVVQAACPSPNPTAWPVWERLLPHALVCVTWIEQASFFTTVSASLLNSTGRYLDDRAQYEEAEPLLLRAMSVREELLGASHPDTDQSRNNLVSNYQSQGKYDEALPLMLAPFTSEIHEEQSEPGNFPPESIHLESLHNKFVAFHNLARHYESIGNYDVAELYYQATLEGSEALLGSSHLEVANNLSALAGLYCREERYEEAESLLLRAIGIREELLGSSHPDIADSLNVLAFLYSLQGRHKRALPLFQRALDICEKLLGPSHLYTAASLSYVASAIYEATKKYDEAEPLLLRALEICEHQSQPNYRYTAAALNDLAWFYSKQGRHKKALPLYQKALDILRQICKEEDDFVVTVQANYASCLRSLGYEEEAEDLTEGL